MGENSYLIPLESKDTKVQEWALVELQGVIDVRHPTDTDISTNSCNGIQIGSLKIKENGVPTFTIGNHFLEGQVVELKKPLMIIYDDNASATTKVKSDEEDPMEIEQLEKQKGEKTYEIKGLIKKKYIFKTRPKPLTT